MKTDPPKTVPIPSLRSVTSNVSPRFITAPVSSNMNTVPLTIQNPGGKPITIPSSVGQSGHKSDVTIAVLPMTNRIIPATGAATTGYHIPRGPAAVANISVPRASLATPIRGGGTIAAVATTGNSSFMPGLSVLRPWIPAQTSGNNPATSIRPITSTMAPANFVPATVRHSSMTVATKVSAGVRGQSDQQNPRPQTVLLQKQIIAGPNTSQMVHMSGDGTKGGAFLKATLPLRSPTPRLLSPQTGGKLPMFPILVPSGASILKTQASNSLGSKVMVSQSTHGTPIQITTVPNPTSMKPAGFATSSGNQISTTSSAKPSLHPVIVTSATLSKYPNIVSTPNTSSFANAPNNPSFYYEQNSAPHPPASTISGPGAYPITSTNVGPGYPNTSTISGGPGAYPITSSNTGPGYPITSSNTGAGYPPASSTSSPGGPGSFPISSSNAGQLGVRHGSNFGPVTSLPHTTRPHQPSNIISAPRGMGPAQFSLPVNRVPGPQPSVLVASRPHFIASSTSGPGSSTIVTTGPSGITRFSQISTSTPAPMIHETQPRHTGPSTFTPVSAEGSGDESPSVQGAMSSAIKPNASPRPSILRKRDIDTLTPMKAQKNLTPMLNANTSAPSPIITSISNTPLPPSPSSSPPKRPDSGSGSSSQSSSSSSSSNGGVGPPPPDGCDMIAPVHNQEEPPLPPTSALISGLSLSNCPVEMSPRKKPRKQLLTGDLQERKMEVEDMEFITEEKIKSEQLREDNSPDTPAGPAPCPAPVPPAPSEPPANKKPHVSLLHSYRQGWKSRHHHFMRYSDVKPKDERRPSLSDIASQKQILQKVNGWKIYHLRTQMENMATSEKEHSSKLTCLLETFEKKYDCNDREVNRVNELIKGNIQRNNVVQDQLLEAHGHLMKIFEHKNTVTDLITKNGNRRTIKKKDKY